MAEEIGTDFEHAMLTTGLKTPYLSINYARFNESGIQILPLQAGHDCL